MLDGKAAQNLSILLGGPLKHMTYEDVKRAVLRCDEEVLTETLTDPLAGGGEPTCCQAADLLNATSEHTTRIDVVMPGSRVVKKV